MYFKVQSIYDKKAKSRRVVNLPPDKNITKRHYLSHKKRENMPDLGVL